MNDLNWNTDRINDVNVNRASTIEEYEWFYVSFNAGMPSSSTNIVKVQSVNDLANILLSTKTISPVVSFTAKKAE